MNSFESLKWSILACSMTKSQLKNLAAGVLVVFAAAYAWAQTGSQPPAVPIPPDTVELAHKDIELGKWKTAIDSLQQFAQNHPPPPDVNRELGIAFYRSGQLADAEKSFADAMNDNPNDVLAVQMRGLTLFRLGLLSAAIPYLERARESKVDSDVDVNYVLGRCYLEANRYDDARAAFALQYGFAKESGQAYLLIAQMLVIRELPEIAKENALRALQLSPRIGLAHFLLGKIFLAKGDIEHALEQFQAERVVNPTYPPLYQFLGDLYIRSGNLGMAQLSLTRALSLDQSSTEPFILMGKLFLDDEDPQTASSYLEHAETMDPSNSMTHYLLAQAYKKMGKSDDAKRELDVVAKMHSVRQ